MRELLLTFFVDWENKQRYINWYRNKKRKERNTTLLTLNSWSKTGLHKIKEINTNCSIIFPAREVCPIHATVLQGSWRLDIPPPEWNWTSTHLQRFIYWRREPSSASAHDEHGGIRHPQPQEVLLLLLSPDCQLMRAFAHLQKMADKASY